MSELRELAERYEWEGKRIAKLALHQFGVCRTDAETAAYCFTIAAALRAREEDRG